MAAKTADQIAMPVKSIVNTAVQLYIVPAVSAEVLFVMSAVCRERNSRFIMKLTLELVNVRVAVATLSVLVAVESNVSKVLVFAPDCVVEAVGADALLSMPRRTTAPGGPLMANSLSSAA